MQSSKNKANDMSKLQKNGFMCACSIFYPPPTTNKPNLSPSSVSISLWSSVARNVPPGHTRDTQDTLVGHCAQIEETSIWNNSGQQNAPLVFTQPFFPISQSHHIQIQHNCDDCLFMKFENYEHWTIIVKSIDSGRQGCPSSLRARGWEVTSYARVLYKYKYGDCHPSIGDHCQPRSYLGRSSAGRRQQRRHPDIRSLTANPTQHPDTVNRQRGCCRF